MPEVADGLLAPGRRPLIPGGGPQTVADVLVVGLTEHPDEEALVSRHDRLTFRVLDAAVARAASLLSSRGVRPGDRVAASMGNHAELVVACLATMRLGAVWVGLNKHLAPPELSFLLQDSGASVFIGDADAARVVAGRRYELPELSTTWEVAPGDPASEWASAVAGAEPIALPPVDPFAPAAIVYTSGTTGRPKGVVHSQHNLLLPGAVGAAQRPDPAARPGVCLPLTILNLMILGPLASFQQGRPSVLMDRVDAVGIAEWIRREQITTFAAVPAMVHDLLTNPEVTDDDLRSLVRPGVGGADCPQALRDLYLQRYGTRITTGYGLTEAPTAVTGEDPMLPAVPGTAGQALTQVSVTVRDDGGVALDPGTVGEICVAAALEGPFAGVYTPMLGYWRRPDATADAFHGGGTILRTGDLGYLDECGNLFITDRKHDLIIRGGANVYPAEVERALHEIPGVAACAVVGVPDERLGERVAAAIQLEPSCRLDADQLRQRCETLLARYKVPEEIRLVATLPRNAMGKIVKREVAPLFESDAHDGVSSALIHMTDPGDT